MANDKQLIQQAASKYGVNPAVLWGIYGVETRFGRDLSTSSAGAQGYMQFEPSTAAQYGVNPHDAASSFNGAAHYMADLLKQHGGNLNAALNAYNGNGAGTGESSYSQNVKKNAASFGGAAGTNLTSGAASSSSSGGGGLDLVGMFSGPLLHALLYLALVAGGAFLAGYGLYQLADSGTGGRAGELAGAGAKAAVAA